MLLRLRWQMLLNLLKNPWVICLLIAGGIVYALSSAIVKVEAIKNPLKSTANSIHKNVKIDKVEVKKPDGTIETHTVTTDTTASDSHTDQKPNLADAYLFTFGAQASYGIYDGTWHGGIYGGLGPMEVGLTNPVALRFEPRVDARLVLLRR